MSTRGSAYPRPVVFARVGWLDHYDSEADDGAQPTGGGSFNDDDRGSEVENFHTIGRRVYGYVQTSSSTLGLNLARLGAPGASQLDNVLVIFVARHPNPGLGQRIVGWYDGASCLAAYGERSDHEDDCYGLYNIVAPSSAARLLDPREREQHEPIPKRKGAFGQSNVFYAEYPQQRGREGQWIDRAVAYVLGYRPPRGVGRPPRPELRDAEPVSERVTTRQPLPFTRDPELLDRALKSHAVLQNDLLKLARRHGFTPKQPGLDWPEFDIGWPDGRGFTVVEVKSLADVNEVQQIRYGIGQLVDYRARLLEEYPKVSPVLAVEKEPSDPRWVEVCRAAGIVLVWPETFHTLFRTRARKRR